MSDLLSARNNVIVLRTWDTFEMNSRNYKNCTSYRIMWTGIDVGGATNWIRLSTYADMRRNSL